jgi:serine protease
MNKLRVSCVSTGAVLALLLLSLGLAQAAQPAQERVWVQFNPGAKVPAQSALAAAGAEFHYTFDELNAFAVSLPSQAIAGLQRNPNIKLIEPDPKRYPMNQTVPFGIQMVQAPKAWAVGATGEGVLVCVIDSGLYTDHEDFQGVNVVGGSPPDWTSDSCGHGTHVAGTIAAMNNGVGVVGASPGDVSLYIVKVFEFNSSYCGWSYSSTVVDAAYQCRDAGANIINMSLGSFRNSETEAEAYQGLFDQQGILIVAAAGNWADQPEPLYPASYDSVISVAAIDSNKNLASFSQRNNQVELSAPGVAVLSTVPSGEQSLTALTMVDGVNYPVEALDGSPVHEVSSTIVSGARCTDSGDGSFNGKVVLCERGDIYHSDKVLNVQAGGGVAVIIYNNVPGGFVGALRDYTSIPSVSMSQEDGQFILANKLGTAATVGPYSWVRAPGSGYEAWSGTSMASPHVAGLAALVWSAAPELTNQELRDILAATAEDLGTPGRNDEFGWGLVQAFDAVAMALGMDPDPDPNTVTTESVLLTVTSRGGILRTTANVVVSAGSVDVTGCFTGSVESCQTATANSNGEVQFGSGNYRGSVEFCVADIQGNGLVYEPNWFDCGHGGGGDDPNSPPSADFSYQADMLTVYFTDTSTDSDGTIAGWNWNFGDGNSSNTRNPVHTFSVADTYLVSLTVMDNDGETGSASKNISVSDDETSPGDFVLTANGYKVKGRIIIDLSWHGATSATVDIYRNGGLIAQGQNDSGGYRDETGQTGGGTFTHKVCEAGTDICSNVTSTTF